MIKPPPLIDGATILRFADVSDSLVTGATRHVVNGDEVTEFAALAIAQYPSDSGFYLFYCNENWEAMTDTYHETLEAAIEQAEFEFHPVAFVDAVQTRDDSPGAS
jgi:hypothetical protein